MDQEEIFEELIKKGAELYIANQEIEYNCENHVFSKEHNKKMKKIFRDARKKYN